MLFLALFRVLDDWRADPQRPWGNAVLLGLLGAGICTLRQSYLPAAAATVVAWFVLRMMTEPPADRQAIVLEACRSGAATFGALLPWMITSYANARTFLFPLMSGNSNPAFGLIGRVNGWEEDRWFLLNIFYFEPVKTGVFFVVAGCLVYAGRRTVAIRAQLLGMMIGFAALVIRCKPASITTAWRGTTSRSSRRTCWRWSCSPPPTGGFRGRPCCRPCSSRSPWSSTSTRSTSIC